MLWRVKSNLLESLYHQFVVVLVQLFDTQGYFIMALAFVFYAKRCRGYSPVSLHEWTSQVGSFGVT